jgi:hypothetical protein
MSGIPLLLVDGYALPVTARAEVLTTPPGCNAADHLSPMFCMSAQRHAMLSTGMMRHLSQALAQKPLPSPPCVAAHRHGG